MGCAHINTWPCMCVRIDGERQARLRNIGLRASPVATQNHAMQWNVNCIGQSGIDLWLGDGIAANSGWQLWGKAQPRPTCSAELSHGLAAIVGILQYFDVFFTPGYKKMSTAAFLLQASCGQVRGVTRWPPRCYDGMSLSLPILMGSLILPETPAPKHITAYILPSLLVCVVNCHRWMTDPPPICHQYLLSLLDEPQGQEPGLGLWLSDEPVTHLHLVMCSYCVSLINCIILHLKAPSPAPIKLQLCNN